MLGVLERGCCRTVGGVSSSEVAREEVRLLGAQVAIGGVEESCPQQQLYSPTAVAQSACTHSLLDARCSMLGAGWLTKSLCLGWPVLKCTTLGCPKKKAGTGGTTRLYMHTSSSRGSS